MYVRHNYNKYYNILHLRTWKGIMDICMYVRMYKWSWLEMNWSADVCTVQMHTQQCMHHKRFNSTTPTWDLQKTHQVCSARVSSWRPHPNLPGANLASLWPTDYPISVALVVVMVHYITWHTYIRTTHVRMHCIHYSLYTNQHIAMYAQCNKYLKY